MHKIRIVAENFADTARITAVPALAIDKENLKSPSRAKIIRTDVTGAAQQDITADIVPEQTVSSIILGRHNFPLGMTLQIILYDNSGSPLHDSDSLVVTEDEVGERNIPWDAYLWDTTASDIQDISEEFDPKANYVYWIEQETTTGDELLESGTTNWLLQSGTTEALIETGGVIETPGFIGIDNVASIQILIDVPDTKQIEIGRLIIGDYISPVYNVTFNHTLEWKETAKQYRTEASTLRSDISIPTRKLSFSLELINDIDRTELQAGLRYVGLRKDFYINLVSQSSSINKERDYSGIMKMTAEPVMSEYANLYYKSKYVMEEV